MTEEDKKLLQEVATSPLNELAFALDQVRNNESLVVLFIFRGQHLLFPGDAQYGNWRWWLENLQPESILPEISFFKVAHLQECSRRQGMAPRGCTGLHS